MNKCDFCGENITIWGRNFPCHPSNTPAFEDYLPNENTLSAVDRGLSAGDVIRNKHGHIAIVTFASSTSQNIRCRARGKNCHVIGSLAMGWRRVKKASPEQAKCWLKEEEERKDENYYRNFRIDPVTNETIYTNDYIRNTNNPWTIGISDAKSAQHIGNEIHDKIKKLLMKEIINEKMLLMIDRQVDFIIPKNFFNYKK